MTNKLETIKETLKNSQQRINAEFESILALVNENVSDSTDIDSRQKIRFETILALLDKGGKLVIRDDPVDSSAIIKKLEHSHTSPIDKDLIMEMAMYKIVSDVYKTPRLTAPRYDRAFVEVASTCVILTSYAYGTVDFSRQVLVSFRTIMFLLAVYSYKISKTTLKLGRIVAVRTITTLSWLMYELWRMFSMVLYLPGGIGVGIISMLFYRLYMNDNKVAVFIAKVIYKIYELTGLKQSVDEIILALGLYCTQFFKNMGLDTIAKGLLDLVSKGDQIIQQLSDINQSLPNLQESMTTIQQQLTQLPNTDQVSEVMHEFRDMSTNLQSITGDIHRLAEPGLLTQMNSALMTTAGSLAASTVMGTTRLLPSGANFLGIPMLTNGQGGTRKRSRNRTRRKMYTLS